MNIGLKSVFNILVLTALTLIIGDVSPVNGFIEIGATALALSPALLGTLGLATVLGVGIAVKTIKFKKESGNYMTGSGYGYHKAPNTGYNYGNGYGHGNNHGGTGSGSFHFRYNTDHDDYPYWNYNQNDVRFNNGFDYPYYGGFTGHLKGDVTHSSKEKNAQDNMPRKIQNEVKISPSIESNTRFNSTRERFPQKFSTHASNQLFQGDLIVGASLQKKNSSNITDSSFSTQLISPPVLPSYPHSSYQYFSSAVPHTTFPGNTHYGAPSPRFLNPIVQENEVNTHNRSRRSADILQENTVILTAESLSDNISESYDKLEPSEALQILTLVSKTDHSYCCDLTLCILSTFPSAKLQLYEKALLNEIRSLKYNRETFRFKKAIERGLLWKNSDICQMSYKECEIDPLLLIKETRERTNELEKELL